MKDLFRKKSVRVPLHVNYNGEINQLSSFEYASLKAIPFRFDLAKRSLYSEINVSIFKNKLIPHNGNMS